MATVGHGKHETLQSATKRSCVNWRQHRKVGKHSIANTSIDTKNVICTVNYADYSVNRCSNHTQFFKRKSENISSPHQYFFQVLPNFLHNALFNMNQACLLCDDSSHHTENCIFPVSVERCKKCQHNVLGNSPHTCNNQEVDGYRPAVAAKIPVNLFKLRWADVWQLNGTDVCYYEQRDGLFKELFPHQVLLCPSTSGMFWMSKTNTHMILHYNALKPVRFTFFIATLKYKLPVISMPFKLDFMEI